MADRQKLVGGLLGEARDVMPRAKYREFKRYLDNLDPPQQSFRLGGPRR